MCTELKQACIKCFKKGNKINTTYKRDFKIIHLLCSTNDANGTAKMKQKKDLS